MTVSRGVSSWLLSALVGVLACSSLEAGADKFGVEGSGGGGTAAAAPSSASGAVSGKGGASSAGAAGIPTDAGAGWAGANEGGGAGDCLDPTGFDGRGCYRCEPRDLLTLENACTEATCIPFDNRLRLPRFVDGELPELPSPSAALAAGGSGGAAGSGGGTAGGGGGGVGFACDALADEGTLVYVTGSTAAKPFLQQIAQQLASQKVFVIYTSVGSCSGVDAIVNGTLMKTGAAPLPASATYWESSASSGKICDLRAEGVLADLGISDVFVPSCPGFELTNLDSLRIRDAHGPIQTMTFAVPSNSQHTHISQQAAYLVFGFGAEAEVLDAAGAEPIWNDESSLHQRSASSGTQAMLAAAIGVPPGQWRGQPNKTSDDVAAALQAASATQVSANAALGILGADYIDSRNLRAQIKTLAYQDTHQTCAFTPDSSDTAKDKRNVRDGHYPIWGPLHLLYRVDQKGEPQHAEIREELSAMIGYLSGSKPLPNGVSLLDVYAQSGLIPECAMRVTRTTDGGAILPFRPDSPCSCLFEKKATGSTQCTPCRVQGDCAAGQTCSQGYCEAQ